MPKALLVAVIFTIYFGSMAVLMGYMALQVRHRDEPEHDATRLEEPGGDPRQDEPGGLLAAA